MGSSVLEKNGDTYSVSHAMGQPIDQNPDLEYVQKGHLNLVNITLIYTAMISHVRILTYLILLLFRYGVTEMGSLLKRLLKNIQ